MSTLGRRVTMGILLLTAAGFFRLGLWQLGRLHERRTANRVTASARLAPPVVLDADAEGLDTLTQHRVIVRGQYDHQREIVVRGDVLQGVPGVRLFTPLLLVPAGPAILVDRGFLPTPDGVTVDLRDAAEPGEVEVRGIVLPVPRGPGQPIEHGGRVTWRRLDLGALRGRLPYTVLPMLVQQTPDSGLSRFPRRLDPPPLDDGPHLAYAVQWFLFAALAAAFAFLVVGRATSRRAPD
jgi:surfeit locus 1 family protein